MPLHLTERDWRQAERIATLEARIAALEAALQSCREEANHLAQQRDYYRAEAGHAKAFGVEMGERWAEAHWALTRLAATA